MKRTYNYTAGLITMSFFAILINSACSVIGQGSYEQPEYTIIAQDDRIEVREYAAYLVARTETPGAYDDASGTGFRRLADYIFGRNRSNTKMAMTSPVIQEKPTPEKGEKMVMTVPVIQEKEGHGWIMAFVIPSEYTLETVPEPIDREVSIEMIPSCTVAAISYSGYTSEKKMARHEADLRAWLDSHNYKAVSPARSARYDPPWTLPFLRRNEILIDVSRSGNK